MLEGHVPGAVLSLPDVTQLVRDQIVRRVALLQHDRSPERVAEVTAETWDSEELRGDNEADALDANGLRVVVEAVEPCLRANEGRGELGLSHSARG